MLKKQREGTKPMDRSTIVAIWATVLSLIFTSATIANPPNRLVDYGPPEVGQVRIVRDSFGVPHLIASDERSLFFGVGYAQAEDQLENMVQNFLLAEGRGAEFLGESHLPTDHIIRSMRVPRIARQAINDLPSQLKTHLVGFVDGINFYIETHRDRIPSWIEPVEPHAPIALGLAVNLLFSMDDARHDLAAAGVRLARAELYASFDSLWGSNQFAVSPQRSASGACQLSMDPHLPYRGLLRWYEMHLVGPGINVMGACFYGIPYVGMGRTANTAWCMTVNSPDLSDAFALTLDPDRPRERYRTAQGWGTFETWIENYRVRTTEGIQERSLPVQSSEFGPVVAVQDGIAYSMLVSLPTPIQNFQQGYEVNCASNYEEFTAALSRQGLVMFNILYADRFGDIFYVSNGRVPRRRGLLASTDVRPADQPWAPWDGVHAFDELPQVKNPGAGYLLNTNSGAHNVTVHDAPRRENFPSYMIRQDANSRSRRLFQLLNADSSITFEEMQRYATDTRVEADEWLDTLSPLLRDYLKSDATVGGQRAAVNQVNQVLSDWDRRADLDSRGAVLFRHLVSDPTLVTAMDEKDFLKVGHQVVEVSTKLRQRFGKIDVVWGDFCRLRRGDIERPVAGWGGARLPSGRQTVGSALRPVDGPEKDGRLYCQGGSSYGMIVDFADETRSVSCLPYGISEHPTSRHFADMMPLFCQRRFKPTRFLAKELMNDIASDVTLKVP